MAVLAPEFTVFEPENTHAPASVTIWLWRCSTEKGSVLVLWKEKWKDRYRRHWSRSVWKLNWQVDIPQLSITHRIGFLQASLSTLSLVPFPCFDDLALVSLSGFVVSCSSIYACLDNTWDWYSRYARGSPILCLCYIHATLSTYSVFASAPLQPAHVLHPSAKSLHSSRCHPLGICHSSLHIATYLFFNDVCKCLSMSCFLLSSEISSSVTFW